MIRCTDGSLYTGSTNHVIRRWDQHRQGTKVQNTYEPMIRMN
ncbi:GIY-YIG nuclease family protein [Fodinibius sp.]